MGNGQSYKGVSCSALASAPFILSIILAYFLFFLTAYLCFSRNFHFSSYLDYEPEFNTKTVLRYTNIVLRTLSTSTYLGS